jgi:Mg2+ and Co2+ transporter CorA
MDDHYFDATQQGIGKWKQRVRELEEDLRREEQGAEAAVQRIAELERQLAAGRELYEGADTLRREAEAALAEREQQVVNQQRMLTIAAKHMPWYRFSTEHGTESEVLADLKARAEEGT